MSNMLNQYRKQPRGFCTKAVHIGQEPDQWNCKSVVVPIFPTISYKQDSPGIMHGFEYSRERNPTRQALEKCLASLDEAQHGLVFSSGMASTTAVFNMLSAGDHLLLGDEIYGGTLSLANKIMSRLGIEVTLVDTTNLAALRSSIRPNTRMLFFESPTNPRMIVTDIAAVCKVCSEHKNLIVALDNTFMTSYFQRPLELGADLVCYSVTKYMNGHTDILMGAVTMNSRQLYEQLHYLQKVTGAIPSPFDCYQVNRSLKTLPMRMEKHMQNSIALGRAIEHHGAIERLMHPALPSHAQYAIALGQSYGYSGIFAFYIKGSSAHVNEFFKHLKIFTLGTSLGGVESLVALPSIMTHAGVPAKQKLHCGITDTLIRVSVGVEDADDLIDDFINSLDATLKI